jgi:hypothetical protein
MAANYTERPSPNHRQLEHIIGLAWTPLSSTYSGALGMESTFCRCKAEDLALGQCVPAPAESNPNAGVLLRRFMRVSEIGWVSRRDGPCTRIDSGIQPWSTGQIRGMEKSDRTIQS